MSVDVKYTTSATATGGRDGHAATKDGALDVKLSTPKELGGGGGPGNNPEQLFAAGYAACFLGAVKLVARTRKVPLTDEAAVTAKVGMGPIATGYALAVELQVSLPGIDRATAEKLVAAAHERCPFSRATQGNIDIVLTVAEA